MAVLQPRLHALQSLDNDEPFAAFFLEKYHSKHSLNRFRPLEENDIKATTYYIPQMNYLMHTTIKAECKKAY